MVSVEAGLFSKPAAAVGPVVASVVFGGAWGVPGGAVGIVGIHDEWFWKENTLVVE